MVRENKGLISKYLHNICINEVSASIRLELNVARYGFIETIRNDNTQDQGRKYRKNIACHEYIYLAIIQGVEIM